MDGAAIEWTREGVRGSYGRRARGERGYLGKYFVRVFESLKHPDRTPWCFAVALDTTPPPPASERFCVVVAVTECGSYEEARERGEAALRAAVRDQLTDDANDAGHNPLATARERAKGRTL
jgi:hypothetical protein